MACVGEKQWRYLRTTMRLLPLPACLSNVIRRRCGVMLARQPVATSFKPAKSESVSLLLMTNDRQCLRESRGAPLTFSSSNPGQAVALSWQHGGILAVLTRENVIFTVNIIHQRNVERK